MEIKAGVTLRGIQPEMVVALMIMEPVFLREGVELIITSCGDSQHSKNSRHYSGFGLDIRTRNLHKDDIPNVAAKLQTALGPEFKIIFEVNHFHLQYNGLPRG